MNLGGGRRDLDEVSGVRVDGDAWLVPCPSRSPLSQHQGAVSLGRPPPHAPPKSPDGSACVHDGFAFCSLGGAVGSEGATPSDGPRSP